MISLLLLLSFPCIAINSRDLKKGKPKQILFEQWCDILLVWKTFALPWRSSKTWVLWCFPWIGISANNLTNLSASYSEAKRALTFAIWCLSWGQNLWNCWNMQNCSIRKLIQHHFPSSWKSLLVAEESFFAKVYTSFYRDVRWCTGIYQLVTDPQLKGNLKKSDITLMETQN